MRQGDLFIMEGRMEQSVREQMVNRGNGKWKIWKRVIYGQNILGALLLQPFLTVGLSRWKRGVNGDEDDDGDVKLV